MSDLKKGGEKIMDNSKSTPEDKLSSDYKDGAEDGKKVKSGEMKPSDMAKKYDELKNPEERESYKKGYADGTS
jgi:hypothetical protein